ncbi:hypothetical protein Xcel_0525 [Xylanimonas cellulosilytica DSM 15894]|uniref:Uncharacterized protein n=1 Tax=Xylanimonas cellulosilytica (strain DSM 15894 / JCM 12276 / CECT 5975 / KCTC 9989 / LMG 20990 / NBRC 107835 / XIL07) TaxID=446471 RepID=D1BW61_XYLCX|nr:hypothetical protein [Xylanimonas cellulosilytica]ACZ29564.1 hypothetical protein Xcel_0525 [Xylanimonas cellulosilytica DSM 15894]
MNTIVPSPTPRTIFSDGFTSDGITFTAQRGFITDLYPAEQTHDGNWEPATVETHGATEADGTARVRVLISETPTLELTQTQAVLLATHLLATLAEQGIAIQHGGAL